MKKILFRVFILLIVLCGIGYNSYSQTPISAQISIVSSVDNTLFTDVDTAKIYLREQMKLRKSNISFRINGLNLNSTQVENLCYGAMSHTGVADEGDYIRWNLYTCSYTFINGSDADGLYCELTFKISWLSTYEMEQEVNTAVDNIVSSFDFDNKTEYEKLKIVYDYVCLNVHYDLEHEYHPDELIVHSTYGAVINQKAVCQGFASLLYRLCLECGIDCRVISGYGFDEHHAWNIVKLEGKYYNVDSTWDRSLTNYQRYFLCTEYNFPNHVRDEEFTTAEFHAQYPMSEFPYGISVSASGKYSSTISWFLDTDGVLTIEGTGNIPNYNYTNNPLENYINSVFRINIGEGITGIGNYAFTTFKNVVSISFPSTLISIGNYALDNCRSLKELNLPYGLKSIGTNAFSECVALTTIEIPDSVTYLGTSVFTHCHGVTYVKLPEGLTRIPDSTFFYMQKLQSVYIPSSVTSIANTAFTDCDSLITFTIPAQITSIGSSVFSDCNKLENIYVDSNNPSYTSIGGVLFNKAQTELISFPAGKNYTYYTVPLSVTKIASSAFNNNLYLRVAYLPNSLQFIDDYAFAFCKNLSTINIPANVTFIGDSAFRSCLNMTSITFNNDNLFLDDCAFANCIRLNNVTLPANLTTLSSGLFSGCFALTSINIPTTVTNVESSVFEDCVSLSTVTLPSNITKLSYCMFRKCSKLSKLICEGNISSIDMYCFDECTKLKIIHFKGSLGTVNSQAFLDTNLPVLYFDSTNGISKITSSSSCGDLLKNVKTIIVKKSITSIPTYVKNNFTYNSLIQYNGEMYNVYSKHNCVWITSSGNLYKCMTCGAYKEQHVHNYSEIHYSPTCTEDGYSHYECIMCGYEYTEITSSPLGHNYIITEVLVEPTCTEEGSCHQECTACGITITSVLDPLGHDMIIDEGYSATCTETGLTDGSHCSRCDYRVAQEVIPASGHSYQSIVTLPTCVTQGYTTHTCHCGDSYVDSHVDAIGHDMIVDERIEPTCIEVGYTEGSHCSRCDHKVAQEEIPALGHDMDIDEEIEPTCTEVGYTEGSHCTRCDHKVAQEEIAALGHDMIVDERVEPTCTTTGLTEGSYCSRCDHKVVQEEIPVLGHNYVETVIKPTCTENGYTLHTCERCNDEYKDEIVNLLGHKSSDWIIVKPATQTEEGLREIHCKVCGKVILSEPIPKLSSSSSSSDSGCNLGLTNMIQTFGLLLTILSCCLFINKNRK